ncbi:MAG: DUF192 domain-containing protein [Burkholderiaceae bacterium]|jgi:uncharacterized membrane protein (UPF0127 family)
MYRTFKAVRLFLAGLCLVALNTQAQMATSPFGFPLTSLNLGNQTVDIEVADTASNRQQGLMYRKKLDGDAGMLFIFPDSKKQCMWMRNTELALSVAFIDAHYRIINLADMQPLDDTEHCSTRPARFALEMNQGWFVKHGIKAGSRLPSLEKLGRRPI